MSQSTMDFLQIVFSREGYAEEVVTDNGPEFQWQMFELFLRERANAHPCSSLHYPQGNGAIECFTRVLKYFMHADQLEHWPLQAAVVDYLRIYRSTLHVTTGVSPAKLPRGRQPRIIRLDVVGLPTRAGVHADLNERVPARVKANHTCAKQYRDRMQSAKDQPFVWGTWFVCASQQAVGKHR